MKGFIQGLHSAQGLEPVVCFFTERRAYRLDILNIESDDQCIFMDAKLEPVEHFGAYPLSEGGDQRYREWLATTGKHDPFYGGPDAEDYRLTAQTVLYGEIAENVYLEVVDQTERKVRICEFSSSPADTSGR